MDCCTENHDKAHSNSQSSNEMKGGRFRMEKRLVLWIVIGVLFLATLFLTFKAGSGNSVGIAQATSLVAKSATASPGAGMVGGC